MDTIASKQTSEKLPQIKTTLPSVRYDGIVDVLRQIELEKQPKNLTETLSGITGLLSKHMKYDGINYAINKDYPLDEKQGGFIDKVDLQKVNISESQKNILKQTLISLEQLKNLDTDELKTIATLLKYIEQGEIVQIMEVIAESVSLKRFFLTDRNFTEAWMKTYEGQTIASILASGTGSCKTVSIMAKMLLETGNVRWKLGIKKIDIIEDDAFHVYLVIHTTSGGTRIYDPSSIFYKGE